MYECEHGHRKRRYMGSHVTVVIEADAVIAELSPNDAGLICRRSSRCWRSAMDVRTIPARFSESAG